MFTITVDYADKKTTFSETISKKTISDETISEKKSFKINKTFQVKLNQILSDRKALNELFDLCHKWRVDYDQWNLLLGDDSEDSEESDELCGSWSDRALQAVYLSYAIKHNQTRMPPCAICGHSLRLGILTRWHDDGDHLDEYLEDARIIGTCSNMKCDDSKTETYMDIFDDKPHHTRW